MSPSVTAASARSTGPATTGSDRRLLAAGVVAGPVYVTVSLTQALTRDGFDPTRHAWSLLANGGLGWIQSANLVVTGLLVGAGALGLGRALAAGRAGTWAPRLLGGYGIALVGAGFFRADPAQGFPPGTPERSTETSLHGALHFGLAGLGFVALILACFLLARRFVADDLRKWAIFSRLTGVLFLVGFVAMAAGGGRAWSTLAFTAAILLSWAWLAGVSGHYGRS